MDYLAHFPPWWLYGLLYYVTDSDTLTDVSSMQTDFDSVSHFEQQSLYEDCFVDGLDDFRIPELSVGKQKLFKQIFSICPQGGEREDGGRRMWGEGVLGEWRHNTTFICYLSLHLAVFYHRRKFIYYVFLRGRFWVDSVLNEYTGYSVGKKVSRRGRVLVTRPH